jgi:hypothetical protein
MLRPAFDRPAARRPREFLASGSRKLVRSRELRTVRAAAACLIADATLPLLVVRELVFGDGPTGQQNSASRYWRGPRPYST